MLIILYAFLVFFCGYLTLDIEKLECIGLLKT